jgi:hypothetical protein
VEANSTGGKGSRRAVAPSDDDDYEWYLFEAQWLNLLSGLSVSRFLDHTQLEKHTQ